MFSNEASFQFGQPFEIKFGRFVLLKQNKDLELGSGSEYLISYTPAESRAGQLVGSFSASQSGESNNILLLTFDTENTRLGIEIVNQWMKEYQLSGLEEKKQTAVYALSFIDEQMDTIKMELGTVERNLLGYREKNRIISPIEQSSQYFTTMADLEKEIVQINVRIQVLDNLIKYISDTRTPYRQVGSTLGIEEPSLGIQIAEYNNLQVQRETMLRTTTRSNPLVANLETSIEKLRVDIKENLVNIRSALQLSVNSLQTRNSALNREITQVPAKEKQLLDITRRQKILEGLYSYLLQKKLETAISSASTISSVRVIEPASSTGNIVSPNRRSTYLMALFLGLLIPMLIIFGKELLNDKVSGREDVQRNTQAAIIGEVGHNEEKETLIVNTSSRRFIAEQFRIIRTNLQYILPDKEKAVILVTSTSSGEGKSFVSTNVGAVMALAGKRTAILEFDIRKPKVMSSLGMAKQAGITNYIIGSATVEQIQVQVPGVENLFVVPCGPVPPNPAELLLSGRLEALIGELKKTYDVLIIDTAPVGLVSDSVILGKFADATLYIIRHNYTLKKQLQLLNEVFLGNKLPRISLVINDIRAEWGYGRYYGYNGYGYNGYGYGYGSDYFDNKQSPKGVLNWARRLLGKKL
jgi:capsular exopolysaccharide synthesis family protein